MAVKTIPIARKQTLQIGILEKLTVCCLSHSSQRSGTPYCNKVSISIKEDGLRWPAYSVAVPEKRALGTLLQGGRLRIVPLTCSCTVKFKISFSSQLSVILFLTHILCYTNPMRLAQSRALHSLNFISGVSRGIFAQGLT